MTTVSEDKLRKILFEIVSKRSFEFGYQKQELVDDLFKIAIIRHKDQEPLLKKIKRIIIGPSRSFRSPEALERDSHVAEYKSFLSYMIALYSEDRPEFTAICRSCMGYTTNPSDPHGVLANASCLFKKRVYRAERVPVKQDKIQNTKWHMMPEVVVSAPDRWRYILKIRKAEIAEKWKEFQEKREEKRIERLWEIKREERRIRELEQKLAAPLPRCDKCGSTHLVTVVYRGYSTTPESICHACQRKETEMAASCLSSYTEWDMYRAEYEEKKRREMGGK